MMVFVVNGRGPYLGAPITRTIYIYIECLGVYNGTPILETSHVAVSIGGGSI